MNAPSAAVNAAKIESLRRDFERLERWVTRIVLFIGSLAGGAVLVLVNAMLKGAGLI